MEHLRDPSKARRLAYGVLRPAFEDRGSHRSLDRRDQPQPIAASAEPNVDRLAATPGHCRPPSVLRVVGRALPITRCPYRQGMPLHPVHSPALAKLPYPTPLSRGTLYLVGPLEQQSCSCGHLRYLALGTPHNFWVCWHCGRIEGAPPTPKPALVPPCDPARRPPDDPPRGGHHPGPPGSRRRRDPGQR